MKKIAVSFLKTGQKFTGPVYIEGENLFILENTAISPKDIELLSSLGVTGVFTEGAPLNTGGSVKDAGAGTDKIPASVQKTAVSKTFSALNVLVGELKTIFSAITAKKPANIRLLWHITDNLIHLIKESQNEVMGFTLTENANGFTMEKNAIDTAILSTVMGQALGLSKEKNQELTAAAILHDVGMLRLPENIVKKEGSLSEQDVEILKSHTIHSFNIMKKELMYPIYVCQIALQHHEHWDGTGYPRRLSGNYINQRALIVSVADAFIAMINKKAYRNSMTGYQAIKTLVSENASYFSPDVLKLFVKIMGIYPIGSGVLLNNGQIAKIIGNNAAAPLRPVIQLLNDQKGEKIDLLTNKKLFIARALDIRGNSS
ncbi:MAG: HD-GYP domain-containing protein [Spirochaetaceae bacterium]|jgi:hypothetical protein|nr:HD-GYP domain-containing protein [Spirochaetaceae bacterium]